MSDHQPASVRPRPELLAPAGDRDCIRAAIENGADAVYFGLNVGFNARARAHNMGPEDLPEIMATLHHRGVKGYVTLNTLVFSDELAAVEPLIRDITLAGVDAVLVQDIGMARLIRQITPDLPIHASTQMTMTSAECIAEVASLGIERVVLARELSIAEIRKIHTSTSMELEAFVHGALCVAYSGQCLTSESLGGRSANRGQCAQACRLPYELICDGQDVDLGDQKYLLSPQDLAGHELVGDLIDAGVRSLKIEGRLKTPEYVANITRHYRRAIDAACAGLPDPLSIVDVREMELSFSRGFSPGWLQGCDHKMLVPALSSTKRGIPLGTVVSVGRQKVRVRLTAPVMAGDGVVFQGDRTTNSEQGGRIMRIECRGVEQTGPVEDGECDLLFHGSSLDTSQLSPGLAVWKTDDPRLTSRLRKTFQSADPLRRTPVTIHVQAAVDQPLVVTATSQQGQSVTVSTDSPLAAARKHPLTVDVLREQFSRLGGSVYELADLTAEIHGEPMLPLSVCSQVRRDMIAALDEALTAPKARFVSDEPALARMKSDIPARQSAELQEPVLRVLVRSLEQLQHAINAGATQLIADFADIREYTKAVKAGQEAGVTVAVATPRIQKPDEMGLFKRIAKDKPAQVLVRNLSGLRYFKNLGIPVLADFSLNVTNEFTAQWFMEQGADLITASYDLNRDQLLGLVQAIPGQWLEVVLHQHMPMFHMEHCVFCSVLSPGTNKTNCGRPCDTHVVHLRDRVGMEHPLTADVGCRNTLFNATAQSGAEAVPDLLNEGVRHFRIELLDEPEGEINRILRLYRHLLAGQTSPASVWTQLNALNRVGVTRGTLESRRDPLAIL